VASKHKPVRQAHADRHDDSRGEQRHLGPQSVGAGIAQIAFATLLPWR
jgi:hypothetical protein